MPYRSNQKFDYRQWLVALWLTFSLALAFWQFVFILRVLQSGEQITHFQNNFPRYLKMVQLENLTLIISLILGGISLFWLVRLERKKTEELKLFLATFTHELKTSLTGLKLKSESNPNFLPLQSDLEKIQLQLENALYLASTTNIKPFFENVFLTDLVAELGTHPFVQIHVIQNVRFTTDKQIFLSILKNIINNSFLHGKSENVWILPFGFSNQNAASNTQHSDSSGFLFCNDGADFSGSVKELGKLFSRPTASSRNGIGLYLINQLSTILGGSTRFLDSVPKNYLDEMKNLIPSETKIGFSLFVTHPVNADITARASDKAAALSTTNVAGSATTTKANKNG